MSLEFLDSVFVNNRLLKGRFKLKKPLLTLSSISDGPSLFQTNLEMTHEGINGGLFAHGSLTKPVPHESLPSFLNGRLIIYLPMEQACVSGSSSNGVAV